MLITKQRGFIMDNHEETKMLIAICLTVAAVSVALLVINSIV